MTTPMNVDRQRLLRMVEEAVSATPKDRARLLSILRECYALGVEVFSLDINLSDDVCVLEGERGLRLGFSALLAGREQFVQDMIAERQKKGAFRSFQHLCERIHLASVPAEFLETCIRAGVFDSIEDSRAALLAGYQKIVAAVNAANAERASNQFSLFAALPAQPRPVALPKVAAWTEEETIEQENASLGFSFTEYLLTRDTPETPDGEEPEALAEQEYEKPDAAAPQSQENDSVELSAHGIPLNAETLPVQDETADAEDADSPEFNEADDLLLEKTEETGDVWPAIPDDVSQLPDEPVLEACEEHFEELVAPDIVESEESDDSILVLALPTALATAATLRSLRDILECHPGNTPVVLEFDADDQIKTHVRVHQDYFVTMSDELRQALVDSMSRG